MSAKQKLFITGTDTNVGKTLVSCALLYQFQQSGMRALGIKPIASGTTQTSDGPMNKDAIALQNYSGIRLPYAHINPVLFDEAIAPHIAAQHCGTELSVAGVLDLCRPALDVSADCLVVEGAGGWRVPISRTQSTADLAQAMGTQVLLVVCMRLGCLNHALLSAEAILSTGLKLAGWVATVVEMMPCLEENINTLKDQLVAPCWGVIPQLDTPTPELAARYIRNPFVS